MINSRGSPFGQAFADAISADEPTIHHLLQRATWSTQLLTAGVQQPTWHADADFRLDGLWESAPVLLLMFSDYVGTTTWQPLRGPELDTSLLAGALRDAGARVLLGANLDPGEVEQVLAEFSAESAMAPFGLLYCTGHGVAVSGTQYVIPIDPDPSEPSAVKGAYIWPRLAAANRARKSLSVWAGCRDNPLPQTTAPSSSPSRLSGRAEAFGFARGMTR